MNVWKEPDKRLETLLQLGTDWMAETGETEEERKPSFLPQKLPFTCGIKARTKRSAAKADCEQIRNCTERTSASEL